jgi:phosphoenolpyruvate synthase/pyruvate phosphate dikinase
VKKWAQALKICFDRYHIAKQREKILEERFVRFKVKMFKVCEQEDWRRVGTEQKPEYVYLNREQIKIGGYTFNLALIRSLKSEKIKIEEG